MDHFQISITEAALTEDILRVLIRLSEDWEAENSCRGYRKNEKPDIDGNRIFLAQSDRLIVGYLFGHMEKTKEANSIMSEGTVFFEVEELYVKPEYRGMGIGKQLFRFVEKAVSPEAGFLILSTATKNWRAILHFYIEELGMEFWSARLFKRL